MSQDLANVNLLSSLLARVNSGDQWQVDECILIMYAQKQNTQYVFGLIYLQPHMEDGTSVYVHNFTGEVMMIK